MEYRYLRSESFFQVMMIQSLALFQVGSSNDLTIIIYPDLERDFVDFKTEQEQRETSNPYSEEVKEDLLYTCQNIPYAKTFEVVYSTDEKESKTVVDINYSRCDDITNQSDVAYENVPVKIGENFENEVPMFPCYKDTETFGYLLVTPGANDDFKFLFKRRYMDSNPIIYAVVERKPFVDDWFLDDRHLEKFFVRAHRMYQSHPMNELSLSILNANQHYRLCSIIEDAREDLAKKKGEKDTGKMEKEVRRRRITVLEEIYEITFRELNKLNPVYAHLEVDVTALPCYTRNGKLLFLLSEDPLEPSSVFVLEKRMNPDSKQREVFVVQHVSDIAFLKNMDQFYKK